MAKEGERLAERILEELKNRSSPVTTLELARAAKVNRRQANPALYGLETQGKIRKVQQQPPLWEIARTPRSEPRSFTGGPGGRGRGRGRGAWLSMGSMGSKPVGVGEQERPRFSGFKRELNPTVSPVVGSTQTDDLEVRLVGLLGRGAHSPQTALELARALGYPSRKAVNPSLYALEKSGAVLRIEGQGPPKWSLRTSQQAAAYRSDLNTAQYVQSVSPFESRSQLQFSRVSGSPFAASCSRGTEEEYMESANLSGEESMDTEDSGPSIDLSHIPPENIQGRLLAVMEADPSVLRTDLELAKAIGSGYTRSRVRPCLEKLAGEAKVRKIGSSFPVKWGVAGGEGGSSGPSSSDLQVALASHVYPGISPPTIGSVVASSMAVSSLAGGSSSAVSSISDLNRNPVSALNEYCQVNKLELKLDVVREFGPPHRKHFVIGARFGDNYFEAESTNKKEGKRLVADLALQRVMASQVSPSTGAPVVHLTGHSPVTQTAALGGGVSGVGGDGFSNMVAKMSQDIYLQLQGTVAVPQPGRKVVAAFVMEDTLSSEVKVVSVGSGTRCITGDQMSLEGLVVNDSHAEVVARRSLMRFFYQQLAAHSQGDQDTIFVSSATTNVDMNSGGVQRTSQAKVKVRDNLRFHLYISTAPCGDSAQFSRGDEQNRDPPPDGCHHPTMTGKSQGVLRTKMEGGEGTIPIADAQPQTWDGILQGGRLRTMSCSDKVGRWNVLGLQGALLSHFMEPAYMSSLILGSLHHHGHLSRAVCCRFAELDSELASLGKTETGAPDSPKFRTNHPKLGRVFGGDEMKRHTEKTSGLSLNWKLGDERAEINDGVTGKPVLPQAVPRSKLSTTCSRISKASMYSQFLSLCQLRNRSNLLASKTYKEAKEMAGDFQTAKQCLYKLCQRKGYGSWMKKPFEQEQFDSTALQKLNINP